MTLVLSLATPNFVVQVSDRRLSKVTPTGVCDYVDNVNKSILFGNRMGFAYTGLAEINGKSTVDYLGSILSQQPNDDFWAAATAVRDHATRTFRRFNYPCRVKRHAFVGVGWERPPGADRYYPVLLRVSNFHHPTKLDTLAEAQDEFSITANIFGHPDGSENISGFYDTGIPLNSDEKRWLFRRFAKCTKKSVGLDPFIRLCIRSVRQVAQRNKGVGKDILVTVIPRSAADFTDVRLLNAAGRGGLGVSIGPKRSNSGLSRDARASMAFLYVPAGSLTPVHFGPAVAIPGGIFVTAFREMRLPRCENPSDE